MDAEAELEHARKAITWISDREFFVLWWNLYWPHNPMGPWMKPGESWVARYDQIDSPAKQDLSGDELNLAEWRRW